MKDKHGHGTLKYVKPNITTGQSKWWTTERAISRRCDPAEWATPHDIGRAALVGRYTGGFNWHSHCHDRGDTRSAGTVSRMVTRYNGHRRMKMAAHALLCRPELEMWECTTSLMREFTRRVVQQLKRCDKELLPKVMSEGNHHVDSITISRTACHLLDISILLRQI